MLKEIGLLKSPNTQHGIAQEGPATHLCLVSIACRSYEKKPDFAGPPRYWEI
jgi:hypothetical protein